MHFSATLSAETNDKLGQNLIAHPLSYLLRCKKVARLTTSSLARKRETVLTARHPQRQTYPVNTFLLEVILLIALGWLTTLYAWRQKWQRQQKAWQWWHQQQTIQSHHTAESIRDDLLQQTFAFRRYQEIIGDTPSVPASSTTPPVQTKGQNSQWLTRLKGFHQSLEALSDELSPPFVADSLPHALQFTLKSWQTAQKLPPFKLELPQTWDHSQSTPQQNQVVLSILNALLNLILPSAKGTHHISAALSQQDSQNNLILKVDYGEPSPPQEQPELTYLKEIFQSLTAGQLKITHETLSITSELSWQNVHPTKTIQQNPFSKAHPIKPVQ